MSRARLFVGALVVSAAGVAGIALHEGTVNKVYLDPVAIPTACVGHTATVTRADLGRTFTDAQCAELLKADLRDSERAVKRYVQVPITQTQYDVLVSFTFNVGAANFANSTLLRKINAGDCQGAVSEFHRWTYARGKKLKGLENRRAAEAAGYATGC
jgi:lysozyme